MSESGKSGLNKGCLIAVVIVGLLFLTCAGGIGFMAYKVSTNPTVQRIGEAMGVAMEEGQRAQSAPGTAEMRAAGCGQALIYTPEALARIANAMAPDGGARGGPSIPLAICQVPPAGPNDPEPPTCDALAAEVAPAYDPPPNEFGFSVRSGTRPLCSGVYGPDGTWIRDLSRNEAAAGGEIRVPNNQAP